MKYKLIKEYPGSPELGTILIPAHGMYYRREDNKDSCERWIDVKISNYPEFWEKVIEKDYEILSLIYNNSQSNDFGRILTDKLNLNAWLDPKNRGSYVIYSVKRLSDGEIFTIGDKIDCKGWFGNIIKFKIINDKLKIFQQQHINSSRFDPLLIEELLKVKKPLFTTEDGVDIFEGDEHYWVNKSDLKLGGYSTLYTNIYNTLYFSTKEKAEEYVFNNKPCISLDDISKIYTSTNFTNPNEQFHAQATKLRKLVKTKLNI